MGRTYAGILGPISFGTVIARTVLDGGSAHAALIVASMALFAFAAIGYVVGVVAERIVTEAIETRFRARWRDTNTNDTTNNSNTLPPPAANLAA